MREKEAAAESSPRCAEWPFTELEHASRQSSDWLCNLKANSCNEEMAGRW